MSTPPALALIVGRAGSRGLPGKNTRLLGGRPLVDWTIDAALAASSIDHVIISTDGDAIADAARRRGVHVIRRPPALATDTAPVGSAVQHAVGNLDEQPDVIVVLYANVPVRPHDLIDRAVDTLRTSGADSVQSYAPVGRHHPHWMVTVDDDRVHPLMPGPAIDRRQDLPPVYLPDGGVIAVTRRALHADPGNAGPHAWLGEDRRAILTEVGDVIDVDDAHDLAAAAARVDTGTTLPAVAP